MEEEPEYAPLTGKHAKRKNREEAGHKKPGPKTGKKLSPDKEEKILVDVMMGNKTLEEAGEEMGYSPSGISRRVSRSFMEDPPESLAGVRDARQEMAHKRTEAIRTEVREVMDIALGPLQRMDADAQDKLLKANPAAIVQLWKAAATILTKIDVERTKKETKEKAFYFFDMREDLDWQRFFTAVERPENIKYITGLYKLCKRLMLKYDLKEPAKIDAEYEIIKEEG